MNDLADRFKDPVLVRSQEDLKELLRPRDGEAANESRVKTASWVQIAKCSGTANTPQLGVDTQVQLGKGGWWEAIVCDVPIQGLRVGDTIRLQTGNVVHGGEPKVHPRILLDGIPTQPTLMIDGRVIGHGELTQVVDPGIPGAGSVASNLPAVGTNEGMYQLVWNNFAAQVNPQLLSGRGRRPEGPRVVREEPYG